MELLRNLAKKVLTNFKKLHSIFLNALEFQVDNEDSFEKNYWDIKNSFLVNKLKIKKINITKLSTIIVFFLIYFSICVVFKPWEIFSLTTTCGGDTGTHHYGIKFMIDNLLPHFRVTGWSNGWYAGMPIVHFYFPLPYLMVALLSKIIPYNIAFKIITVLGSFILPACAYWMVKLFRFKYPYPLLASIGATLFLFMESYSIYGGNFLSTLAGEFGYSFSFALCFLFLGTMHLGLERGAKYDWLFVLNCFILMALTLSHVLTTICLIVMVPWLLLENRNKRNALYTIYILMLGFFLTAFWSVPFALKLKYTPNMGWNNLKGFRPIVPNELIPAVFLAILAIIIYIIVVSSRDDNRLLVFSISYLVLILLFFAPSGGRVWNARLLPFIYILTYFLAMYTLYILFGFTIYRLSKFKVNYIKLTSLIFVPLIALLSFGTIMGMKPKAVGWATYNYTGYETKPYWKIYNMMMNYIDSKPEGRWMVEQDHDNLQKLGTTRAFELIPYWTKSATMEGLLVEGAFTAPFHFTNQALLSKKPSNAIPGLKLPSMNIKIGIDNLKMMNVRYMIASSKDVKELLDKNPDAKLMAKFDEFNFYEINTSNKYVEILKYKPVKIKTNDWYDSILPWFKYDDPDKVFIIWDQGEKGLDQFKEITDDEVLNLSKQLEKPTGDVVFEKVENEKITFKTTAIGVPHIIKVSYFPNWKVEGGYGPYAISPSFMMVIPTQSDVTLYYASTKIDIISRTITQITWVFLLALFFYDISKFIVKRKRKKI